MIPGRMQIANWTPLASYYLQDTHIYQSNPDRNWKEERITKGEER